MGGASSAAALQCCAVRSCIELRMRKTVRKVTNRTIHVLRYVRVYVNTRITGMFYVVGSDEEVRVRGSQLRNSK